MICNIIIILPLPTLQPHMQVTTWGSRRKVTARRCGASLTLIFIFRICKGFIQGDFFSLEPTQFQYQKENHQAADWLFGFHSQDLIEMQQ